MGLSFIIAAGPRQRSHSQVWVPRDPRPNFTVSESRLPQPGELDPRIYIPRNMVAPLYTQALDSLFVASYDSQGYGGGIRPRPPHGPMNKFVMFVFINILVPVEMCNFSLARAPVMFCSRGSTDEICGNIRICIYKKTIFAIISLCKQVSTNKNRRWKALRLAIVAVTVAGKRLLGYMPLVSIIALS
jgi:hypothetical protein